MSFVAVGLMAASTAVSMSANASKASASNVAGLNGQAQGSMSEAVSWDNNAAENAAIGNANLQNMIRTGYKIGLLNVQRAQAKKAAMQQGIDLSRRGLALTAQATANQAASGTIGSSVQAVITDIQQRQDEAGAQMGSDYAQQEANYDVQMHDVLTQGEDLQRATQKVNVQQTPQANLISGTEVVVGTLGGVAMQAANSYLGSQMSLGTSSSYNATNIRNSGGGNTDFSSLASLNNMRSING